MRIDQLMRKPAITCRHSENLQAVAQRMWEQDCGVLPVVDDAGKMVGIVTDRDVCMAAYTQNKTLSAIPVTTAMAKAVFSMSPGASIEAAEQLMGEKQVHRLPVADADGKPLGVISMNDIARYAAGTRTPAAQEVALKAYAAIAQPRAQPQPLHR